MAQTLLLRLSPQWQSIIASLVGISTQDMVRTYPLHTVELPDFESFFGQHFWLPGGAVSAAKLNASLSLFARLGNVAMLELLWDMARQDGLKIDYLGLLQEPKLESSSANDTLRQSLPAVSLRFIMNRALKKFNHDVTNALLDWSLVMPSPDSFNYFRQRSLSDKIPRYSFFRSMATFTPQRRIFIARFCYPWALSEVMKYAANAEPEPWMLAALATASVAIVEKYRRLLAAFSKEYSYLELLHMLIYHLTAYNSPTFEQGQDFTELMKYLLSRLDPRQPELPAELERMMSRTTLKRSALYFELLKEYALEQDL